MTIVQVRIAELGNEGHFPKRRSGEDFEQGATRPRRRFPLVQSPPFQRAPRLPALSSVREPHDQRVVRLERDRRDGAVCERDEVDDDGSVFLFNAA